MTLHEAIIKVLNQIGQSAPSEQIANLVNQQKIYHRKDGNPVSSSQVSARINNYLGIFYKEGSKIGLISWKTMPDKMKSVSLQRKESVDTVNKDIITDDWDVRSLAGLRSAGFKSIGSLGLLLKQGLPHNSHLKSCGLYAISIPKTYRPGYYNEETAKSKRNVINPWSIEKLKAKWVPAVDIVYYGLAGKNSQRPLRSRLNDLLKHGNGKITDSGPHKGGEILWQLMNYEEFTLWILPTDGPPVPRDMEHRILIEFNTLAGSLPFANRQL